VRHQQVAREQDSERKGRKRTSGAKARDDFCRIYAGVETPASLRFKFFSRLIHPRVKIE
jgi:hypothetical protein